MRLLPHRGNLVVWSQSACSADRYAAPQFARPAHTRRVRRLIRTGVLLTVAGPMRLAGTVRTNWQACQQLCELERELAAYSTPAQRCDLEATFDRYPDDVTYELRDILDRQATAAIDIRYPAVGR